VGDDGGVVARAASEHATVGNPVLHVANDGTLRHHSNWENVSDAQCGLLSGINELASVHSLHCDEQLLVLLEFVLVSENHFGKGGTTSLVVNNLLHDTLDVPLPLSEIKGPVLGGSLASVRVSTENAIGMSSPLCSDNATHGTSARKKIKKEKQINEEKNYKEQRKRISITKIQIKTNKK